MSNPGNENRRIERDSCREALSKHIYDMLSDKVVAPSKVRLQPSPSDGYKWSYKESKSHLFKKPLSELSTNSYIELREALKEGAIKATRTHNESPDTEWRKLKAELDGACNRVAELEGENQQLYQALQRQSEKLRCLQRCFAENKGQLESALFIMETVKKAFDSDSYVFE
ncbi:uncharacterized protein BO88DRAFT_461276 [Aspergillus vadensis CBS 113365]|uniref:Uncharacterized protein n=1 Tax=Aspergillus vadensis (strain CBS 113365 / IMI 142717 / IBT 24658) TaxID=1448311 RepID=A0A319BRV9_ASPVC|nr:hypothetical protein BO88DRAFT_461276 [Aspergillus vadensis CBS 113365]PYH75171.1 hypothetical protein BO88DRAFT_461276 [Aspergillus vadensis CBS 113365]